MKQQGTSACALNAANEIVVSAFLKERIGFIEMPDIIEKCMNTISFIEHPTYEDLAATDKESRQKTLELI